MKKWICAAVLMGALLLCFATAAAETTTIMMYMCGTDLQSDCLKDIREIEQAKYGDEVKVVILAGGAKKWDDRQLTGGQLNLFTVAGGKWSPVQSWGKKSMGSSATLAQFVNYCLDTYPADRNMLIMWDHGSSAAFGMCYDEVFNDDALTMKDISEAMASVKASRADFHLDIVGADACLMASYEMATILGDYASYYVASEELEPDLGWYYVNWLNALGADPGMDNETLARAIVDSYRYDCERKYPNEYLTLSVIRLSAMEEVTRCVDALAQSLQTGIENGALTNISRTVRSCYVFGSFDDAGSDMIDMVDFIDMAAAYDSEHAAACREALEKAVIYSYANKMVPSARGMSILVPVENKGELNSFISGYAVDSLEGYSGFVVSFAQGVAGGNYVFSASASAPQQMQREEYSPGFIGSAYGYSYGNSWGGWNWRDDDWWEDDRDWGWGYGYGSGWGYNNAGTIAIAGNSGTGVVASGIAIAGMTGSSSAGNAGIQIAGGNSGQQTGTSGVQIAGGTVIASVPVDTAVLPAQLTASTAFDLKLQGDDLRYLAYAEMRMMIDLTEEGDDELYLMDMGCVRDTWIDWNEGYVYSTFDGTWPGIDDINVVLIDQAKTELTRRSLVPILLNNTEETYLIVQFEKGSDEGRILGTGRGWDDNGLPVRGIRPLQTGDVISPVYIMYYGAPGTPIDEMEAERICFDDDDEMHIIWDGTQTVRYTALSDNEEAAACVACFRLHDVFGEYTDTKYTALVAK